MKKRCHATVLVTALTPGLLACGADEPAQLPDTGSGTSPAVMVAVQVGTQDSDSLYVGVYPELPERELDLSQMLEVQSGNNAHAHDGHVYVWDQEAGSYTRYSVDDSLRLSSPTVVSFAGLGASGSVMTRFTSPNRAYSLTRNNTQIVVWDPQAMVLVGSISTAALIDPEYPDLDYGEPVLFGDYVAWPILWYDYENLRFKREVGVVLASTTSTEPAVVVRDTRCGGGWSLFTDAAGDLYATGNAWFGFAHFFAVDAASQPNDCVLRMRAGSAEFDPDYYVDLNQLANTPAVYHTWKVTEDSWVAAVWDPEDDPSDLADADAYWEAPLLRKLVWVDEGRTTLLDGIPKSAVYSTLDYRLDDTLYMLVSEGSATGDGRSSLYRVTESGAVPALSTSGDLWAIGRVR